MLGVLYPYPTLRAELAFDVAAPLLDGDAASDSVRQPELRAVNLFGAAGGWRRATLPISAQIDKTVLKEYQSRQGGDTTLLVVANCRPTNTRQAVALEASGEGEWEGALELDRDNYRGRVEVRPLLTQSGGKLARKPVGFGVPWNVYFDRPNSFRFAGTLAVRWVNFRSPDAPALARQFPDSTHVVSFEKGMPEILLNEDFGGLHSMLKDQARRGTDKGLHDLLRTSIARSVWMALTSDALAAVVPGDGDEGPLWPAEEWQKEVLRRVALAIEPGKSDAELLELAAGEWRTHPDAGRFQSFAEAFVGDVVKANETLRRFAQTYGKEEQP